MNAFLGGAEQPRNYQLHGELHADGRTLVLFGLGDLTQVIGRLHLLTPHFAPTPDGNGLQIELRWPVVVQLAGEFGSAWRPGPRLQAWIYEQVQLRNVAPPLTVAVNEGAPPPRSYQETGARLIAAGLSALICDDPGCITGDAVMNIHRAGKGYSLTLRDLVHRFSGGRTEQIDADGIRRVQPRAWDLTIPTYVQREVNGVVRLGRIVHAWYSGVKTTYTVTTESGRSVRATDEHPFLTERGWVRLDEMVPGDLVHVRGGKASGKAKKAKPYYREVAGLYAHPFAHHRNAKHSPFRVGVHRLVAEARLNGEAFTLFVNRIRSGDVTGLVFLDPAVHAVHHEDHDPLNNAPDNLSVLTHLEHHQLHANEGKTNSVLYKVITERVLSVEKYGEEETFDIEVVDEPHNFLANGFVVHNTGKTLTTLLGLMQLRANGALPLASPILVVCPASVVDPWIEAARRWTPFRVAAWRGPAEKRRRLLDDRNDLLVTSYGLAARDADPAEPDRNAPLRRLAPAALVVDECHLIKNPSSLRSKSIRALGRRATSVIPLSGTPITHNTGDLHPTLQAMDHVSWPSRERYAGRYLDAVPGDYSEDVLGINAAREPEFRMALHGQYRRLAKADVLTELPEKVYSTRTVTLPPAARKAYDAMAKDMLAELDNGQEIKAFEVVVQLQRLLQLACASADVSVTYGPDIDELTGEPKEHTHVHLREPSWKVDAFMEVLEERPGKSVLVFAPSRQLVVLGGERAAKEGRRVGYVVGGQSQRERTAQVAAFQAGELDVLCATTGAGGVGLTMTAASTVVFLQRPWSFNEALQAEDRAHRMGSEIHDSIEIIDIVAEKTIDAQVRDVMKGKAGALAELLQDQRIVTQFLGGR